MKLRNVNALITGASQGLGKVIAQRFVEEGANVLFCARDAEMVASAEATLREIARPEQKVIAHPCDVSSETQVAAIFKTCDSEIGPLHALVNNAGIYGPKGLMEEVDLAEWRRCIEINLFGAVICCRHAVTRFKKLGSGKIINLSGGGATRPLPRLSAYAASKAAVVRLTETLAEELRPWHIDVNSVAPGALNTRLLHEILKAGPERVGAEFHAQAVRQAANGGVPLVLGADVCVYLASPESDGISGKLISAQWDPWPALHKYKDDLDATDIYTLRRITPEDRNRNWSR
jgi:NAD(P)-dependent dehydrogenase (short-subunit alcohol dehydrogenase family)